MLNTFPKNDLISHYRATFSTSAGKEVLKHIHFELGTFSPSVNSPEEVALKNYGSRLLYLLSGGEPSEDSIGVFMDNLMKQALPEEKDAE